MPREHAMSWSFLESLVVAFKSVAPVTVTHVILGTGTIHWMVRLVSKPSWRVRVVVVETFSFIDAWTGITVSRASITQ